MDDSPRSTKRRKLDSPTRNAPTPRTRGAAAPVTSTRKSSERISKRTAVLDVQAEDIVSPGPNATSTRKALGAVNGTPTGSARKRGIQDDDASIYDDFEGALGEESPAQRVRRPLKEAGSENTPAKKSHPLRTARSSTRLSKTKDVEEPKLNGRRKRGRPARGATAKHSSSKQANGSPEEKVEEVAEESEDELALEPTTPSGQQKGAKGVKAVGTTKSTKAPATPSRTRGRRAKEQVATIAQDQEVVDAEESEEAAAPAIRLSKRTPGRAGRTPRKVSDARNKQNGSLAPANAARRWKNRADHTSNREDTDADELDHEDLVPNGTLPITNGVDEDDEDAAEQQLADENDGSVLDPMEPSPFNPIGKQKTVSPFLKETGKGLKSHDGVDLLKTIVTERIIGKRPVPLIDLDEEYRQVRQLMEATVVSGEGNSMLVYGARGSGKTALVNKAISELTKGQGDDFHVIRLNGFIHTDDKIALREIWRQLGKEMEIEEDGIGKNYADTLATLLALLSHPSEHTGEESDNVAKAVIFVMDEFDLFASHPRQTLLYNLFDIAQSRKAPIAVLGLTTRIDVTDGLEKRVKSRFSHRYVHLSLPKTFTAFQEICKAALLLDPEHLSVEERAILCTTNATTATPSKRSKKIPKPKDLLTEWNSNISALFASPNFLKHHLNPRYHLTKSVPTLLTTFLLPTLTFTPSPLLIPLTPPPSKLSLLPSLPHLHLSLLICACRLDIILDSELCNFNMVYDEYVSLASKARVASAVSSGSSGGTRVWGRGVARRAWEGLVGLGLLVPVGGGLGDNAMVRSDVALEEIGPTFEGRGERMERVVERWCRQI